MNRYATLLILLGGGCLLLGGCRQKPIGTIMDEIPPPPPEYDRPLPAGELALVKITDPAQMPDIAAACSDVSGLKQAVVNSLHFMAKRSSRRFFPYGDITHEQAVASLQAFAEMLDSGLSGPQLDAAIRAHFDVYTSVGWDGSGTVLFTGYYTPIFDGSLTKTDRFHHPLYTEPKAMVKTEDGTVLGLRGADGSMEKCPPRKDLEQSGRLAGTELVYLADPFDAYVAHVQGSAQLRLPDGKMVTVGYAANNGHEYVSIGKELVREGKIAAGRLNLQTMMDYFRANPQDTYEYTWRNPRYVFFAFNEGAPRGSLNEPVTPMRTIATDKAIFPRASLAMVVTELPRSYYGAVQMILYTGFAVDQDTGGAIRAAGRCDLYMGIGPDAGQLAGFTQKEGRLYYLFLKPSGETPSALPPVGSGAE